ncbi:aminotransferase [Emcibacter nanhaiensis]|uniref:Aminotransferase class III-fold pyridoxal phosphate-dependent enzyme n=1 Tax=Emcibacter nanhaiensis TaxID=1505037 RepID=A0A501PFT9_9PROT|nr:aminotransferase [Emcibacter nanhaiensis]TPD59293.1 aminotransferase class III-fold pyridoxal phosphate-dependent enzyme [Emcibacter nanhaiensis]
MSNYAKSIIAGDREHVLHPTTNLFEHRENGALVIERGQGIHVYDVQGKEYIEGMAGLWCTSFGFSESELVDAAVEQMRKLPFYHGFGNKAVVPTIELARRLKSMVPFEASKVFFTNSGSEANDTQLKMIWYYNNAVGRPEKKKIIARWGGYHGVTIATACLTGLPAFRGGFDQPLDNILHVSCPHYYRDAEEGESEEEYADRLAEELEQLILREDPDTIAAFIAEPVMAGGGVIPPPRTYFEKIQKILRQYDIITIADEVVCGFGRTGNMFGCETVGMQPDTMTVAKQLSSAYMPIAAVIIPEWMYEGLVEASADRGIFGHGITYGGHPVPAAVALRNLELFEERDMMSRIRDVSPHFQERLRAFADHPMVGNVRGVGLIGAVELVASKEKRLPFEASAGIGQFCDNRCIEHGLIHRFSGNAALFCPPLIITAEEIDEMFKRFGLALDETYKWARETGRFPG